MFRLASLVCFGCQYPGKKYFYDNDKKRPCLSLCGHALCTECINTFKTCPICYKPIEHTENYAARVIYEESKNNPMAIFKSWWNSQGNEKLTCTGCYELTGNLRLCITCDSSHINHIIINGKLDKEKSWMRNKEKVARRKQLEQLDMTLIYLEKDSDTNMEEIDLEVELGCDYFMYTNLGRCPNCILDNHDGHLINIKEELEPLMDMFKQTASHIATGFLFNELANKSGKCKIKTMRMHRTCEKLTHFAKFYFRSPNTTMQPPDPHLRYSSVINKFFKTLSFKNIDMVDRDNVDELTESLEKQLKNLDCTEECDCCSIWEEMHKMSFGNQIEKLFVEKICEEGNNDVSNCFFPQKRFQPFRIEALELWKSRLHLIYSVFCWNETKQQICCLFDRKDRKPYKCPECGVTVCMKCNGDDPICNSKSCQAKLVFNQGFDCVTKIDNDALDLVDFYKENCIHLFEHWWKCDAHELGYCMSCHSYSEQLEVCAFCELCEGSQKRTSALKTKPELEQNERYSQSKTLFYNYEGLKMFPTRWQCVDCKKRLDEKWVHENCDNSDYEDFNKTWKRGCNHRDIRIKYKRCSNDDSPDGCEYSVINLKDVECHDIMMKITSRTLIFKLVNAGIIERVECKLRRIRMLILLGMLKTKIMYFLQNSMKEKKSENLEELNLTINELIQSLKIEWMNYQSDKSECSCMKAWIEDYDKRKPCTGTCGHTICLECVERKRDGKCPICNKVDSFKEKIINVQFKQNIEECYKDYWNILKEWWSAAMARKDKCPICEKSEVLRICMTCDRLRLCEYKNEVLKLRMRFDTHLLTLAKHVFCADCYYKHHSGHDTIAIKKIDFAEEEIKMTTSNIILELFRNGMKSYEKPLPCKLQLLRIELTTQSLQNLLEGTYRPGNESCGGLLKQIRLELIRKRMRNLEKQLQAFFEKSPEERQICKCTEIYEKLNGTAENLDNIYTVMAIRCTGSDLLGCPLFFKSNSESRQMLLKAANIEDSTDFPTSAANNEIECPLCPVLIEPEPEDFRSKQLDFYDNNCVDIFANWWKSECALGTLCLKCLTHLNQRFIGVSCKKKNTLDRFDKLYQNEATGLFFGKRPDREFEEKDGCITKNCALKNPKFWKYAIKSGTVTYARSILKHGLYHSEGVFDCKLRKMRMMKTGKRLVNSITETSMKNLSKWENSEITERFKKIDELVENLKSQWEEYRFGNGGNRVTAEEEDVVKCECTLLWDKNDQKLRKSLIEISEYAPHEQISGCLLNYDHMITLKYDRKFK